MGFYDESKLGPVGFQFGRFEAAAALTPAPGKTMRKAAGRVIASSRTIWFRCSVVRVCDSFLLIGSNLIVKVAESDLSS